MANPFTSKTATYGQNIMPGEWAIEQRNIERGRRLAEALQAKAEADTPGQMVSGIYVAPSWTQGLAKVANAWASKNKLEDADKREVSLQQKIAADRAEALRKWGQAAKGTPESMTGQQYVAGNNPDEDSGMGYKPAVAPNPQAAYEVLMTSNHPDLQQLGMQQMMAELTKKKENPFGKVDPKDFTAESVAKFATSGNYADLVPARKMEIAPSGVAYNPFAIQPGQVFNDPNKLMGIDGNNQPVVNQPLVDVKKQIAKEGASKTTNNIAVNTEKQLLGQVGETVGKEIGTNFTQAKGAVGTINTVNQIRDAISSGNVNVGPGATAQQFLGQVSTKIGIGGKDSAERLNNTRKTIQGLAQLELDGAQQLKGQGQITEGERDIVRRAASGEIDKLSLGELKTLMDVIDKSARLKIVGHNDNMGRLSRNPNARAATEFMGVQMPPAYSPAAPTRTPMGGALQKNADGSFTYTPR